MPGRARGQIGGWTFAVLAVLASAAALASHLLTANLRDNPGARFEAQLDGTAARPYAYRVLAPALARTVEAALPGSLCGRWESCTATLFEARGWPRQRACGYLAAFILMGAALLGYAWAARWLFGAVLVEPWPALLALASLASTPLAYGEYGYLYDLPQLALFTLGLALQARGRWRTYALLFPWLCLSKETSILLVLLFVLHFRQRLPRRLFAGLLAWQLAVWLGVRSSLQFLLSGRPGAPLEVHLDDYNLPLWRSWWYSGDWGWLALGLLGAAAALGWRWGRRPAFLRDCLWMGLPLLALATFFGYFDERRHYMEIYAPLWGLLASGLPGAVRAEVDARVSPR